MTPFDYSKCEYLVTLPNGISIICWPNADTWHAIDGSGRVFQWDEIVDAQLVEE